MDIDLLLFSEGEGESAATDGTDLSENTNEGEKTLSTEERFEEMIKGEYADAFNKRTQGIIDRRFKKLKSAESTLNDLTPLIDCLGEMFPDVGKDDPKALAQAFLKSRADEVKNNEDTSPKMKVLERYLGIRAATKLSEQLKQEEEKTREIYPSFDLRSEYTSSPEFRKLLSSGVGVRRAFETVNLEKIMGTALRYAVMKAGKSTADTLSRQGRVPENSLRDSASSVRRRDVKNLSEKEIMNILSEVGKGAKITF